MLPQLKWSEAPAALPKIVWERLSQQRQQ